MHRFNINIGNFAIILPVLVFALSCASFFLSQRNSSAADPNSISYASVAGNSTPVVSGVAINSGSPIVLVANATRTVYVSFTVTDNDSCTDVFTSGFVTTTVLRSGVGDNCTSSYSSCYRVTTTTNDCSGGSSANATATFEIYYFADATDASSSYSSENWRASVSAKDAANSSHSATSSGVELNTLLAINISTSSINYGTISAGQDTSSTNQIAEVFNAGNSSSGIQLSGTALVSGANKIATTSQHYATSTFTYGGTEQLLQQTAQTVLGFLAGGWGPNLPGGWNLTTSYPTIVGYHGSFIKNNYIYGIGGYNGSLLNEVYFAPINTDGSLGAWTSTTPLPTSTMRAQIVNKNAFVYVIGGDKNGATTSTVYFASINSTGSINSWATTTPLPTTLTKHAATIYGNYVYVVGGATSSVSSAATTTVLYNSFNPDGTLSSWATTTPLNQPLHSVGLVASNGYLYRIGGLNGPTSSVAYAPINATGSLGAWTETNRIPSSEEDPAIIDSNNHLFSIGGWGPTLKDPYVRIAPVLANGSLSAWQEITQLPIGVVYHTANVNNGYVYVLGGNAQGVGYVSSTYYSKLSYQNIYWGLAVPQGTVTGTYSGTNTFTAVFTP